MQITIPDEILQSAEMSVGDLMLEVAILLYQQRKISSGQARRLAGIPLIQFQRELASREICINYDVEDFQSDLETLQELGDL